MKKTFLLSSLFEEFFNSSWEVRNFPKEDDSNFNKTVEEFESDTHVIKNETWKSLDGTQTFKRYFAESKPKLLESEETLRLEMKKAIDAEDFEKAAMIRDRIRLNKDQKLLSKKGEK